jgi:hypothetical protein
MTLKIKETDWITIDLDNPKTLPETGKPVIVMLNLNQIDKYGYETPGPYISAVFQDSEDDKFKWIWVEPEEVKSGDKYVVLNLDALEDRWITVDLCKRATFPEKNVPCLINSDIYMIGYISKDIKDYLEEDSTLWIYWNGYSKYDKKAINTGDKYIVLDFDRFPWLTK